MRNSKIEKKNCDRFLNYAHLIYNVAGFFQQNLFRSAIYIHTLFCVVKEEKVNEENAEDIDLLVLLKKALFLSIKNAYGKLVTST